MAWEKQTGRHWFELTAAERAAANEEIEVTATEVGLY
jgi:hypothetical protein